MNSIHIPDIKIDAKNSCLCHSSDLVTIGEITDSSSVEYSLCKRGVLDLSPGLTAHFSRPVTFIVGEIIISV